jgi:hypothetical protein
MTLPPVARRSLALVAATALLTSGATGLLTGIANAVPNTATVDSISPTSTNNSGNSGVTLTGSGFVPSSDAPLLAPTFTSAYAAGTPGIVGTTDGANSSPTTLQGSVPTTNAAPGVYDVYAVRKDPTDPSGATLSGKCPACFTIHSSGAPDASNVVPGASTGTTSRGALPLDVSGQNLAQASYVFFYLPDGVTKDAGLGFTAGDPNDSTSFPGYASSALIRGNYTHSGSFTPGKHLLRVTNTAGETGAAVEFWQPSFAAAGVSPNATGAGTQNKVVTVTGQGIRQGSRLSIQGFKSASQSTPTTNVPDVSVGPSTVSADGTSISAQVSFTEDAQTGTARSVSINGPDGGSYSVAGAFTVNAGPTIGSLDQSALGQGAVYTETISGTGFSSGPLPTFKVSGTGVTTQTLNATNISAQVRFTVAPDAVTGARSISVTNPDGGTSTASPTSTSSPFTVDAGPTVSSVTPGSAAAGTSKTITIKGTNFDGPPSGKITVQFSVPPTGGAARTADPSLAVGTVTVTKGVNGALDTATFTLGVASNAPAGLRDVVVTNPSDFGAVLCAGCFGVDNLTVSPTAGSNNGTKSIAMTGAGVVAGSTAKLVRAGDPTIQPDIQGSAPGVSGSTVTAVFDLTDAAPGTYNAVVTTPSGSKLSCSSCFTVTGSTPSITSVSPAAGGQGAVSLPITITGNNFSRGEQITITDVHVHDVVFISRTQLSAKVDIASNAPIGAKDVKATNADGAVSGTLTGGFTVSPPPNPTGVSPTSYGQGAKAVKITVTGPGFVSGSSPATSSKADFGPGVTVTAVTVTQGSSTIPTPLPGSDPNPPDTLVATVDIAPTAPAVQRDVVVTNPDGGVGTLAKAFAVNFGPQVTGITPQFLAPNATNVAVTIAGSNFSTTSGKTAVPTIAGVTLKSITVVSPSSITATASVDSGTAKGGKAVVVTNPTDSGVGTCTNCLYVATPPNPPTNVTATSTASSVTASWTAPADNGGAPITAYVVSAKNSAGKPVGTPATVSGTATKGTVTGLTSGVKYSIYVIARNVAGDSTPGSTIAQTGVGAQTVLTSSHSPSLTTTGQSVTLSGKLIKISTGTGIAGATIELALAPDIGSATFPKVTTNSAGVWSYRFNPVYSHTIKTIFRGNSNGAATQASSYRMGVSTRVTVSSPANGVRSSVRSPLVVRGTTSPNKGGSIITLYRFSGGRYVAVQNVRVASNGSYAFSTNLGRGDYTLKVGIGRTTGNFVGYSPAFGVHRV